MSLLAFIIYTAIKILKNKDNTKSNTMGKY